MFQPFYKTVTSLGAGDFRFLVSIYSDEPKLYSEVESAAIIRLPQVHFITSNGQPASEYGHRTTVIRHFSETWLSI